jgi:hypothetical protein
MDQQLLGLLIEVMQPRLVCLQDEVRLKTHDVLQETSELIDFAPNLDHWARVLFNEDRVIFYLLGEI